MYIKEHPLTKKHEDSQDNLSYSMTKSCHHNNGQTKQHTNQKHSGNRIWNGQPHNTETARVGVELRLNCQQTSRVTLAKQTQFQKKKGIISKHNQTKKTCQFWNLIIGTFKNMTIFQESDSNRCAHKINSRKFQKQDWRATMEIYVKKNKFFGCRFVVTLRYTFEHHSSVFQLQRYFFLRQMTWIRDRISLNEL